MEPLQPRRPCLYAIYDLSVAPVTFDVMNFFVVAHIWALRAGFAGYHLIFVLGAGGGFRNLTPKDRLLPDSEKIWRVWHMLIPHAGLARNCLGTTFVKDRAELALLMRAIHPKQVFPPDYTVEKPNQLFMLGQLFRLKPTVEELDVFHPSASALERIDEWLARRTSGGRVVTITLRTSRAETGRNSRLDQWLPAARHIKERGFVPVIVPDTDLVTGGVDESQFGGLTVCGIAAVDLDLRQALAHRATLNIADNGGPTFLNFFTGGSTLLCFLPVERLPAIVGSGGIERMAELLGVEAGGDFPHASALRRFVWRPDDRDAIIEEFEKAAAALEAPAAAP